MLDPEPHIDTAKADCRERQTTEVITFPSFTFKIHICKDVKVKAH